MFDVADRFKKTINFFLNEKIGKPIIPGQKGNLNIFAQHSVILANRKLVVIMGTSGDLPVKQTFTKAYQFLIRRSVSACKTKISTDIFRVGSY
ncbi:MAG: hypothetical protein MUO26_08405 [Methanotrichaceae archaeon]|nr:hypothetical protein [Methanotrichaceae archaeon]